MPGRLPKPEETITRSPTVRPFSAKSHRQNVISVKSQQISCTYCPCPGCAAWSCAGWPLGRPCANVPASSSPAARWASLRPTADMLWAVWGARRCRALARTGSNACPRRSHHFCLQQIKVLAVFIASVTCLSVAYHLVRRAQCLPSRRAQSVSRLCRLSGRNAVRPPTHVGQLWTAPCWLSARCCCDLSIGRRVGTEEMSIYYYQQSAMNSQCFGCVS